MTTENTNELNVKHGLIYFLWIMTVWIVYVLFLYPSIKSFSPFYSKLFDEIIRILIFAVPVLIVSYKIFSKPLEELGISKNALKGIILGLTLALFWFSISVSIEYFGRGKQIQFSSLSLAFWLTGFSVSTFVEELGFRSFLLQTLKSKGITFAIIASSLAFVFIHYPGWILFKMMPNTTVFMSASISIFILGCVLGLVFIKTKSIWAVVIIHAFNNLAAALMTNTS